MMHLIWSLLIVAVIVNGDSSPSVTLSSINSVVQGSTFTSYDGRPFNAFRGIPYGKSTSGEFRFKPPQPVEGWTGVFDANNAGTSCPQYDQIRGVTGSEDCLHLNVYSPKLSSKDNSLFPVIVYIHGGGFVMGSGSYDSLGPERWMDHDVVLVTPNYRLGVFGFLNTEDSNAYGNLGLLDQVLALKWVQDNIEKFGGDPSKVTISGQSAGSLSVLYHLLSPLSSGLFHAAIAQSCSFYMAKGTFMPHALHWAKKFATKVNCTTSNTAELVECMRGKTIKELLDGHNLLKVSSTLPLIFSPSVEALGGPGFLTADPSKLIREGKIVNKVPTIIGTTADEFYLHFNEYFKLCKGSGRQWLTESLPKCLKYLLEGVSSKMHDVFSLLRENYYEDINVDDNEELEKVVVKMIGDMLYHGPISQTVELLTKAGVPTYSYKYNHIGQHSLAGALGGRNGKYVAHADEIFLQFKFLFSKMGQLKDNDYKVAKLLNSLWTTFASHQHLVIAETDSGEPLTWERYDVDHPKYLEISLEPKMVDGKLCLKDKLWTETIPNIIKSYKTNKDEL